MDLGAGPGFTERLDAWVAAARIDGAAAERARERWLAEVAGQEATLSGVLADLAERRAVVAVATRPGRRHRGTIGLIGADFVVLRAEAGSELAVSTGAITDVRSVGRVDVLGDRMLGTELRLADVLAELAADREEVALVTSAGDALAGRLRNVGQDVLALRVGDPPTVVHVPLAAVVEVRLGPRPGA